MAVDSPRPASLPSIEYFIPVGKDFAMRPARYEPCFQGSLRYWTASSSRELHWCQTVQHTHVTIAKRWQLQQRLLNHPWERLA